MTGQLIQIAGSLLVLGAFIATQARRLAPDAWTYLALNAGGSGILAVLALVDGQWGFLLLESVWALVSAAGLVRKARTSPTREPEATR
ncbi:MAG: hypothetical protein FWD85_08685 [Microbacteriaceae bacterium]|nr:hypothetical protein [Microbacteriaceae bacterium]